MTKFVISGYGKMGHMVEEELLSRGLTDIVTSEDICSVDPQYAKDAVCIDFTTPAAFRANFRWIAKHFRAAVVGTTGWEDISEEVFAAFERGGCTLIWGSNFSIGVIATFAAIARASKSVTTAQPRKTGSPGRSDRTQAPRLAARSKRLAGSDPK